MAKKTAVSRSSKARLDDEPVDSFFEVPAAVLCALCGQADCPGCTAATEHESGVLAIVPWERSGGATTLTAEQICYAAGSPGRVFKLDEDSVITRLMRIDDVTDGAWQWVDTAGLRQVQRTSEIDVTALIPFAYPRGGHWKAVA